MDRIYRIKIRVVHTRLGGFHFVGASLRLRNREHREKFLTPRQASREGIF